MSRPFPAEKRLIGGLPVSVATVSGQDPMASTSAKREATTDNEVRSRWAGICALDGGLFARKDALYGRRKNEQPAADLTRIDQPPGRASDSDESSHQPLSKRSIYGEVGFLYRA